MPEPPASSSLLQSRSKVDSPDQSFSKPVYHPPSKRRSHHLLSLHLLTPSHRPLRCHFLRHSHSHWFFVTGPDRPRRLVLRIPSSYVADLGVHLFDHLCRSVLRANTVWKRRKRIWILVLDPRGPARSIFWDYVFVMDRSSRLSWWCSRLISSSICVPRHLP